METLLIYLMELVFIGMILPPILGMIIKKVIYE